MQGVAELPSGEVMIDAIEKQHEFNTRSFVQVKRHALMVSPSARDALLYTLGTLCVDAFSSLS